MQPVTLKTRIIVLLTIFTIFIISVFISIQLLHEVDIVSKLLILEAKNYSKQIEKELGQILNLDLSFQEKINLIEKTLLQLKNEKIIKDAYIFDSKNKIIVATFFAQTTYQDIQIWDKLNDLEKEIVLDRITKTFSLYTPLKEKEDNLFIVRLFFSLSDIWRAFSQVYQPAILIGLGIIIINIVLGVFLERLIIKPIKIFNEAAQKIAAGNLELKVKILTGDELQELAETFNYMSDKLIEMKERAENANPLTKLPGNIVIMEEIEKRIKRGEKFTVIYADLDNFKAFNDKYGIAKGDEAIKLTAQIFKEALAKKGNKEDFLGHEGGDDFILLTSPQRAQDIANFIIEEFDKRIRSLYLKEDLEAGYIITTARDGSIKKFPIMTISLAAVSNLLREITSYAQITNIAAEVKKKAKSHPQSCFILDKRKG
ncbi:MAG: diguanylate cyclase [Candidatus Omnitrophica bacterium]|nr:diguanylate cyclase [Candidatus Omnitrophota bacterium]